MHYRSYLVAGIAQQLAEIYYIVGAQQLEGYGQVRMVFQHFHLASNTIALMYTSTLPINCTKGPNIFSQECFLAKDDAGNEVLLGARYQKLQIVFFFLFRLSFDLHFYPQPDRNLCEEKQRPVSTVQMEQHH